MAKEQVANYTPAQEAAISAAAPLDLEKATALATQFGKKPRSIIAKAVRMGVPYVKKTPVTKNGDPVIRKETLVTRIGEHVSGSLEGLEKASKPALVNILAAFDAFDTGE